MIRAEELRIGNLVQHYGYPEDVWKVDFTLLENISLDLNQVEGIPLTEEWLVKFGFERKSRGVSIFWETNSWLVIKDNRLHVRTAIGKIDLPRVKIDYVHQLQNVWYSLIGEELTISI